jgi:hypothetical protein
LIQGQKHWNAILGSMSLNPRFVMIEGCCLAGAGYMGTPDGRDGWGQYFLSQGYAVYIMDQVGRGRSP